MALASEFDPLNQSAGRVAFGGRVLRQRLSLHRRGQARPFAWFDDLPLPINSVAFHPTQPVIAIGAGIHDGGLCFNGDLVLWNWTENVARRPFSELPEVVHLTFNKDGGLDLLCHPWTEDWGQGYNDDEVVLYPLQLEAVEFGARPRRAVLDPEAFIRLRYPTPYEPDSAGAREIAGEYLGAHPFVEPRAVLDVGWFGASLGWVTGEGLLHRYNFATATREVVDGESQGVGVAIVSAGRPLVQTVQAWRDPDNSPELQTRLVAVTPDGLSEVVRGAYRFNITASADGAILGRQVVTRGKRTSDFFRDRTGQMREPKLDTYDPVHHFLGVDGAPDIYALTGARNVADSWTQLCRLTPQGEIEPLWPLLSDWEAATHATECNAVYVDDDFAGPGVIVSGLYYPPRPAFHRGFLYRRTLEGGELWRLPIEAAVTVIVWLPSRNLVVTAFLDGRLALIDAPTGQVRLEGRAVVQGVPTVIYAMAAHGDGRLGLGAIDGQVMLTAVDDLIAAGGLIELA